MKRGFTLIELLAVITILGVISIICIISVGQVMTNSKNSLSKTQEKYIIQAAKDYYVKEGVFEELEDDTLCVALEDLVNDGYLESTNIKDPKTNEVLGGSVIITVNSDNNNASYEYSNSTCSSGAPE